MNAPPMQNATTTDKPAKKERNHRMVDSTAFIGFGVWRGRVANVQFGPLGYWVLRRISGIKCLTGHNSVDFCRFGSASFRQ
jgi:hypothetical protein